MVKHILVILIVLISITTLCGCSQPNAATDNITGHVYLDGHAINGAYTLNIRTKTQYYLSSTCKGLQHTVWPVYLPGEMNMYDISLTTGPRSTIEGSGYARGGHSPWADHMKWSGVVVNLTSVKDNTTLTALTDSNGRYSLEVEPNVLYNLTGASSLEYKYPIPVFYYHNYGVAPGYCNQIMVSANETALVDYEIRLS